MMQDEINAHALRTAEMMKDIANTLTNCSSLLMSDQKTIFLNLTRVWIKFNASSF